MIYALAAQLNSPFSSMTEFTVVAISSMFFLVDPFNAVPLFIALTASSSPEGRKRAARKAALTCFIVLTAFALAGSWIFRIFGITLPAFEIAGGLILLLIGIEMIQGQNNTKDDPKNNPEDVSQKDDIGITPMGVPMLAGPGAISTVMVLTGASPSPAHSIPVIAAIAITALASYLILAAATRIQMRLGGTGIRIMMRIMGLMLTAIAIQFVINGLNLLGLVHTGATG
jgi:multiple antibiotic resistance protein